MIKVDCEQGGKMWMSVRRGIPTSSEFKNIVTTKGKRAASCKEYLYMLASERITGETHPRYFGFDMALGQEREAEARSNYEWENDLDIGGVEEVGFIYKDDMKLFGASTDGLVGDDGVIEIKNAQPKIHLDRMMTDWNGRNKQAKLSSFYQQVQGELFVTGRKWCDLVSYCRGMKLYVKRIYPDLKFFKCLEEELYLFNEDLIEVVKKYKETN